MVGIEFEGGRVRHGKYEQLSNGRVTLSVDYYYGQSHNEEVADDRQTGAVISRHRYDRGRLLEETWYFDNGQISNHVTYTGHRMEAGRRLELADGTYADFYADGKPQTRGKFKNVEVGADIKVYRFERIGLDIPGKSGDWVRHFQDGSIEIKSAFQNNLPVGPWIRYERAGVLRETGQHNERGTRVGTWDFYDGKGNKCRW